MRTLCSVLTLAAALTSGAKLFAEEKAAEKPTGSLVDGIQDLNLTDEQEAKIADIRKEYRSKVQGGAKDLATLIKEEVEKARGVITDEQKTKLAALRDERKALREERLTERLAHLEELDLTDAEMAKVAAIREEYRPKIVKALESMRGLLTNDQRMTREEALKAGKNRREILAALKLSDEQKEKIAAVGKELRALVREELEKMRDVLSEGQKEKLDEFKEERKERVRDRMAHALMNFKDLNLTADQKTKLADIRKEYRPKIHEAGNKLRATVREEMEAIVAVLKG